MASGPGGIFQNSNSTCYSSSSF